VTLIWYRRPDSLWNADCACGSTCCGIQLDERAACESWHFESAARDRDGDGSIHKHERPPCGPKFPEADPNHPEPFVFA